MLRDQFDLSGKTALITGSSQGIGEGIALGLAEYGANIIVQYHSDRTEGQAVAKKIEDIGRKAYLIKADFSKPTAAQKLFDNLENKNWLPDILVINASVQIAKEWIKVSEKDFDTQVNTNFKSTLKLFQLFIPPLIKKKWGRIVTLGSVQQVKPHPAMTVYAATKSAVENRVKNIALQIADTGVTVNNLAPGVIGTPRIEEPVPEIDEDIEQRMATPMDTIGAPIDCASLALLLCSDAGKYITGQNIFVDGGMSL